VSKESRARRATERERRESLRWWARPGVILFLSTLALALIGWGFVVQAGRKIPVESATIDGLRLDLGQARWILDQMDHGENFSKPSVMMPDMPEWGKQRVTFELELENVSDEPKSWDGSELMLVPEIGDPVPPIGAQAGHALILPGQKFNTAIHFDFDTTVPYGKLRAAWSRAGDTYYLPVPTPAEHYHLRPRGGEIAFPPQAELVLPVGIAERGELLFKGKFGCSACHGDPAVPGSNNVGPHLGSIGRNASTRVDGVSGAQYVYDSILNPSAAIAPNCGGGPCPQPTAMPEYASLMTVQEVADLLAFLLDQQRADDSLVGQAIPYVR